MIENHLLSGSFGQYGASKTIMTEFEKRKRTKIDMRTAAVLWLGSVCLLCMLFLAIVLPLRKRVLNTPAPTASFTPAPTAEPTPSPVPPPPSVLTFDESTDDPMPQINDRLKLGHSYKLRGTVQIPAAADKAASDPLIEGFAKAGENALPQPSIPEMDAVWNFWGVTEAGILAGTSEPVAAWDKMVADIEAEIAK